MFDLSPQTNSDSCQNLKLDFWNFNAGNEDKISLKILCVSDARNSNPR